MEQSITANQRDSSTALTWGLFTGVLVAVVLYIVLMAIMTISLTSFEFVKFPYDFGQTLGVFLSHATQIEYLMKIFDVEDANLKAVNKYLFNKEFITYIEYLNALIASVAGILITLNDYNNSMKTERFIQGVKYFDYLAESKKALQSFFNKEISGAKDEGVKVGGVTISRDRETKHFAVIGKTGGGKTVALLPIMRDAINRDDKVLIFDNKGDFTKIINDKNGNCPVLVAPWDARSAAWDIARDCRTRAEAAELASKLISDGGSDPMWSDGARQVLTGLIHKLQVDKQENWGWSDLAKLLYISIDDVEGVMDKYHPEGKRVVEKMKDDDGKGGASKTTQSLLITMSAQLSPVYRMAEAWADATEKFSIKDFLDGNLKSNVVILQGNAALANIQNAYIQGIISMLANRINSPAYEERPASAPGLWLFLDEFPQLGKLPEVKPFLEIGRSKGVRVVMGFQNPSQLKELYDKDGSDSMLDIFQSYIFCMLGSEASEWASKSVGKQIIERFKMSQSSSYGSAVTNSASWERSEEYACKPTSFTQGLGVDVKAGGTWALYWPTGADVYKLLFKFSDNKELRKSSVQADWVTPGWDTQLSSNEILTKLDMLNSIASEAGYEKPEQIPETVLKTPVIVSDDDTDDDIDSVSIDDGLLPPGFDFDTERSDGEINQDSKKKTEINRNFETELKTDGEVIEEMAAKELVTEAGIDVATEILGGGIGSVLHGLDALAKVNEVNNSTKGTLHQTAVFISEEEEEEKE